MQLRFFVCFLLTFTFVLVPTENNGNALHFGMQQQRRWYPLSSSL